MDVKTVRTFPVTEANHNARRLDLAAALTSGLVGSGGRAVLLWATCLGGWSSCRGRGGTWADLLPWGSWRLRVSWYLFFNLVRIRSSLIQNLENKYK